MERLALLRSMSQDGVSKDDAAEWVGLSVKGLDTFLYRYEGSTVWPIGRASADRERG